LVIASIAPFLSVIFAIVTVIACGKPKISVIICRLIPEIFSPASYPLFLAQSVFFTLGASAIQKLALASLPCIFLYFIT
jgi:hypothetical protein